MKIQIKAALIAATFFALVIWLDRRDQKREKNRRAHETEKPTQNDQSEIIEAPHHLYPSEGRHRANREVHWERQIKVERSALLLSAIAAALAVVTAWIFQGQLEEMRDEQRPWIGLHGIGPVQNANAVAITIINSGKTPAMHVRAIITGGQVGVSPIHIPDKPCASDCTFDDIVMLPNVPLGRRVPPLGEPLPPPTAQLWLAVRVDYSDTKGISHHYWSCLIWIPPHGDISSCPKPYKDYAD